jgi:hypothetical protein
MSGNFRFERLGALSRIGPIFPGNGAKRGHKIGGFRLFGISLCNYFGRQVTCQTVAQASRIVRPSSLSAIVLRADHMSWLAHHEAGNGRPSKLVRGNVRWSMNMHDHAYK